MQHPLSRLRRYLRSVQRSLWALALLLGANLDFRLRRPRSGVEGAIRIQAWCRRILAALGLSVRITGTLPESGAVVSNHLSYLDILLYSAIRPFVMVAKREVRSWPLLGWLTAQAGTVYVERGGDPSTYPAVNRAMAEAYRTGLPVLFFPEGTTTNGAEILPFRRGLFHSVLDNDVALRTAALRFALDDEYAEDNGNATVADQVCWWGDAYLGPHLFRCLGLRGLRAEIHFEEQAVAGRDRFALSENARAAIAARHVDSMAVGEEQRFGVETPVFLRGAVGEAKAAR
jgi:1-acyl-sn-glycerol-3-phosphate acyltransferase